METREYIVPEMTCSHCEAAVKQQLSVVPGVTSVQVELETKHVRVTGISLDDEALRAAVLEAGFDVT